MKSQRQPDEDARANLDRIVDGQLCAEHDGDLEAILAPMADSIALNVVGSTAGPIRRLVAVRCRYREFLTATVHERGVSIRPLIVRDLVFDERTSRGRVTGPALEIGGRGRWIAMAATACHGHRQRQTQQCNDRFPAM